MSSEKLNKIFNQDAEEREHKEKKDELEELKHMREDLKVNIKTLDDDLNTLTNENIKQEADKIRERIDEEDKNIIERYKTKINNVDAEIVIKAGNDDNKTDEEIEQIIKEKHDKISKDVNDKSDAIAEEFKEKFKFADYSSVSENFKRYTNNIYAFIYFPEENVKIEMENKVMLDVNSYIRAITNFKDYDAFSLPNEKLLHDISEMIVIIKHCNEIFNFEFVKQEMINNLSISELNERTMSFIQNFQQMETTRFETALITSTTMKIIMTLNCNVDFSFRDDCVKTDDEFIIAIEPDIKEMKKLQKATGKQYGLWKVFTDALLSTKTKKSDRLIYHHNSYEQLNYLMRTCIEENVFLLQELLGNMLKCYLPSMIFSYFFMIKTIHIMARLVSIYVQNGKYQDKTKDEQVYDVYCIGALAVILYEIKYNLWSKTPRAPLKNMSEKSIIYFNNHVITGGHYYILKEIEESLPVIVNFI